MRRAILILPLAIAITLTGCAQSVESQLANCRMDALKTFFHFREKNELGIRWPPTTGELDYVELCMKSRGFELDVDKMRKANPDLKADAGLRDILYSDKANWK